MDLLNSFHANKSRSKKLNENIKESVVVERKRKISAILKEALIEAEIETKKEVNKPIN